MTAQPATATAMVWLNGVFCTAESARIDISDRGFTLGDGVFETLRVKGGRILRLERHLERLAAGLGLLGIAAPYSDNDLAAALAQVAGAASGNALLRLTVTRGPGQRGIAPTPGAAPTVLATAAPYSPPAPVKVIVATVTRRNEHSPLSRIKSTNYLDGILARMEASRAQADDAILLNIAGRIAESTISNLFAVIEGDLVTPPVADGALPGIVRSEILATLGAAERSLLPADLMRASEIFLTSSSGIRPVAALQNHAFPAGPVTAQLAAVYSD